ncbi:MAG TPA: ABC transporter permease [Gaiellaceae bacterium]|nr:ABC transporter permease [Gaiellaceae bacterium]
MAVDHRELTLPQGPPAVGGETAGAPLERRGLWKDAYVRFTRNKAAVAAAAVFGAICLYCLLVPIFSPYDPNAVKFSDSYLPASLEHPFGTDKFGRDLFTRVAVGGRISIGIGFAGTIAILTVGVLYGSIAGFLGGIVDDVLMRILDALYGLPYLPFAIITTQILSPNGEVTFWTMVAALTVASWFTTARIVRGQVTTLKQNEYVGAARAVGARWHRILRRHILPNTMGVLIIAVFLDLPAVVLGEAFLSFIGLGINPPTASWGSIAQDGRAAYVLHPLVLFVPSIAIATLVLCANFIADGLRDALDPRTRAECT